MEAVQTLLAHRQQQKAAQNKKQPEGKIPPGQKPAQINPAQDAKPNPAQNMIQAKQVLNQNLSQGRPTGVQKQKPVAAQNQVKPVKKPVPGQFPKPQFVSWVPTNASVPASLTINEHLGPRHNVLGQMRQRKKLPKEKEVS